MKHRWLAVAGMALPMGALLSTHDVTQVPARDDRGSPSAKRTTDGPYARIAIMHPLDGHAVDFEAAYIRHLAWHQQAKDTWTWYGWTVNYSERRMWFIYASFGHSAASLDSPVDPAGDDRDNIMNVAPHVDQWGNALYEYLPALSRGTGVPEPAPRAELTTVDLIAGGDEAFEAALAARHSMLKEETLWYRMVAGGPTPRYLRLRAQPSLTALLDGRGEQPLAVEVAPLIAKTTIEILTLRPTMSLGLGSRGTIPADTHPRK